MGKGYWVWVKGFFFPLPQNPRSINPYVLSKVNNLAMTISTQLNTS
ncbi:hypothetical protein COO91_08201 [Nostoc flagelliforme CCNUN1]|uniref:Uncharacterized protein n=1 Tax=Nostoc flagelliforme CCNUN1 TaxID=2038116 RepID=A0A2K8T305_9NOSO|nr:hypothetical protein COO91_08201 [Nostoc flagelliforme CCNUN1]